MADIELVIKMPKEKYDAIKSKYDTFPAEMKEWGLEAIRNGTLLPEGHGDLIDRDDLLADSYCIDDWAGNEVDIVDVMTVKIADAIIESDEAERESKE